MLEYMAAPGISKVDQSDRVGRGLRLVLQDKQAEVDEKLQLLQSNKYAWLKVSFKERSRLLNEIIQNMQQAEAEVRYLRTLHVAAGSL